MRRFNLPGFHSVNASAALHLDTDVEPTITVVDASTEVAADDKKIRFIESSNIPEEIDSTKQYNILHISGVKGILFKGGNTIDFGGGNLALHINTEEEPAAGYSNEKITVADRNTMEEVDSTNHINILHMNSIKDLFFRIPNNTVFNEYETIYTRGTLYNISGRTSQGVNIGLNGQGASVSGQVLTLIPHNDDEHSIAPTVTLQYQGQQLGTYQGQNRAYYYHTAAADYDLPVAVTIPSGATITDVDIAFTGLVAGWGSDAQNIDWVQNGNVVTIYGYDWYEYNMEAEGYIFDREATNIREDYQMRFYYSS